MDKSPRRGDNQLFNWITNFFDFKGHKSSLQIS